MNKPIDKMKSGNIILDVWENPANLGGERTKLLNFTFSRVYLDKKAAGKDWKFTGNFREKDLTDILVVAEKAIEKYGE